MTHQELVRLVKEAANVPGYGRWRDFLLDHGVPFEIVYPDEPVVEIDLPEHLV